MLLATCRKNPHPLYVSMLTHQAASWRCDTHIDPDTLPLNIEDAFRQLNRGLDDELGPVLVETALIYLSLLPCGVSEVELCDVMTYSGHVLQVGNSIHLPPLAQAKCVVVEVLQSVLE